MHSCDFSINVTNTLILLKMLMTHDLVKTTVSDTNLVLTFRLKGTCGIYRQRKCSVSPGGCHNSHYPNTCILLSAVDCVGKTPMKNLQTLAFTLHSKSKVC